MPSMTRPDRLTPADRRTIAPTISAATLCPVKAGKIPHFPPSAPPAQGRYRRSAGLFRLHAARVSGISPPRVSDIRRGTLFPA
ncbi:protein of unknown function (plasmid) [Azospirillum lipoferum 4B]|uniref:Uncharacterized protein n=1 Tax=Azospirillum lipoferum (strain 4B) TaxID=862719 RepID=G7ZEE8_AZOL4|nr:protein of unknown function [Azospirillum lipoferum 4B]